MILNLFLVCRTISALESITFKSFIDFHKNEIYPDILGKSGVEKDE